MANEVQVVDHNIPNIQVVSAETINILNACVIIYLDAIYAGKVFKKKNF